MNVQPPWYRRTGVLIAAAVVVAVLAALVLLPTPSTTVVVTRTRAPAVEVGGAPSRRAYEAERRQAAPAPLPAPVDAEPEPEPAEPADPEPTDTDADGRIDGLPPDAPPIYTVAPEGIRAVLLDTREAREACLDELPVSYSTPPEVTATLHIVDVGTEGRVQAVYLPSPTDAEAPLISCLTRTLIDQRFEEPRRDRIGLTATWPLDP